MSVAVSNPPSRGAFTLSNFLRNSGFWFAQRQAPATLTTYSSATNRLITADGWGLTCQNASAQYVRADTSTTPEVNLQSRFYGNFTKITSTGKLEITQCLEGAHSQSLRGRTVRVQIKVRGLVAASALWNVGLAENTGTVDAPTAAFFSAHGANGTDPTLGASLSYITPNSAFAGDGGGIVGNKIQATVTNSATWIRIGGCFDVPTTAKNLIVVIWSDSQVAATNGIAVGEACLVDGTEIQAWSPAAIEVELLRCQRFYCKSFNVDVLPAQNVGLAGAVRGHVSVAGATANQPIGLRYPVPMRATPTTFVFFNPSAANAFVRNTTAGSNATASAAANSGDQASDVTFTGIAAWTVAQSVAVHFTADAEL